MALKPLVLVNGRIKQLPPSETIATYAAQFITIAIPHTQEFEYVYRHTYVAATAADKAIRAFLVAQDATAENDAFETAQWRVAAISGVGFIDFLITAPSYFGGACKVGFIFEESP